MANGRKPHDFKTNPLNPDNKPRLTNFDNKVVRTSNLDKHLALKIMQSDSSGRIFVEFTSSDGKLTLQKSFQNTVVGNMESLEFQSNFKGIGDLRKYFGMKK
jgi:hypothetical protein